MIIKKSRSKTSNPFFKLLNLGLIYLLIILLPTQLGKHFFFDFSYINGIRVDYLAPTLYLTDIIIIVLILFYRKIIVNYIIQNSQTIKITSILILVNILLSQQSIIALYSWLKLIEVYFLYIIIINSKINSQVILKCFLVGAAVSFFLAIYQLYFRHSFNGIFYWLGERNFTISTIGLPKTKPIFNMGDITPETVAITNPILNPLFSWKPSRFIPA